jgi:hypothetical protein
MPRKIDVRKDEAAFDFIQPIQQQPKPKSVAGKLRKGKMTREESARILGIQYKGDDEYDG